MRLSADDDDELVVLSLPPLAPLPAVKRCELALLSTVLGLMLVSDSDSQCPPPAPALLVVPVVPPADLLLLRPPSDRPDFFFYSPMTGVIGAYIFENTSAEAVTANGERCKQIPNELFLAKLEAIAINYVCFQQDGSTAHFRNFTKKSTTYTVIMATVIMTITINVENQSPFVGLVAFIKLFIKSLSDGKTDGGGMVTPSIFVVAK
uniref:Uncharacterized protein n=1 Tax=Glossina pallidipes TaxID=7398 RepID=A0A1A9ZZV4_GLOPL